ncbi:hypothetical protein ABH926_002952 [Catenulispora sp. GP43]|uniref:hypothetical protein n=1 Tax=Catenulispora sp. GP43 TaxID=3156263 RepID=UPI0035130D5D
MTHDASAWRQVLTEGFSAFLDRPLSEYDPDASYGAYYWAGNFLTEIGFAGDARWVDPEALAGRLLIEDENIVMYDVGEVPPRFDAGASVFVFEDESALPAEFATELSTAAFPSSKPGERLVLGRELGTLLARHSVDLADEAFAGAWSVLYPRIASDGTLVDALRVAAAVGVDDGPDSLIDFDGEPDEHWEASLSGVAHPGLRAHLSFGCQDAGEASLRRVADDELSFWGLAGEGCSMVVAWDETENQVEVAVFRLAGALG